MICVSWTLWLVHPEETYVSDKVHVGEHCHKETAGLTSRRTLPGTGIIHIYVHIRELQQLVKVEVVPVGGI